MLGVRYKHVNFGAKKSPGSPSFQFEGENWPLGTKNTSSTRVVGRGMRGWNAANSRVEPGRSEQKIHIRRVLSGGVSLALRGSPDRRTAGAIDLSKASLSLSLSLSQA